MVTNQSVPWAQPPCHSSGPQPRIMSWLTTATKGKPSGTGLLPRGGGNSLWSPPFSLPQETPSASFPIWQVHQNAKSLSRSAHPCSHTRGPAGPVCSSTDQGDDCAMYFLDVQLFQAPGSEQGKNHEGKALCHGTCQGRTLGISKGLSWVEPVILHRGPACPKAYPGHCTGSSRGSLGSPQGLACLLQPQHPTRGLCHPPGLSAQTASMV